MKPRNCIVKLLKAIYLVAVSTALILIGYVVSGGTYNAVSTILFVLGVVFFVSGALIGIDAFKTVEEIDK